MIKQGEGYQQQQTSFPQQQHIDHLQLVQQSGQKYPSYQQQSQQNVVPISIQTPSMNQQQVSSWQQPVRQEFVTSDQKQATLPQQFLPQNQQQFFSNQQQSVTNIQDRSRIISGQNNEQETIEINPMIQSLPCPLSQFFNFYA